MYKGLKKKKASQDLAGIWILGAVGEGQSVTICSTGDIYRVIRFFQI